MEPQNCEFPILRTRGQKILRRASFIDQIWIKNIKLISLDDFWRWIVHIVMRLVVFVPFEARVDSIEVPRLARAVLV